MLYWFIGKRQQIFVYVDVTVSEWHILEYLKASTMHMCGTGGSKHETAVEAVLCFWCWI